MVFLSFLGLEVKRQTDMRFGVMMVVNIYQQLLTRLQSYPHIWQYFVKNSNLLRFYNRANYEKKTILISLASVLFIIFAVILYKSTVNMKVFNHSKESYEEILKTEKHQNSDNLEYVKVISNKKNKSYKLASMESTLLKTLI